MCIYSVDKNSNLTGRNKEAKTFSFSPTHTHTHTRRLDVTEEDATKWKLENWLSIESRERPSAWAKETGLLLLLYRCYHIWNDSTLATDVNVAPPPPWKECMSTTKRCKRRKQKKKKISSNDFHRIRQMRRVRLHACIFIHRFTYRKNGKVVRRALLSVLFFPPIDLFFKSFFFFGAREGGIALFASVSYRRKWAKS